MRALRARLSRIQSLPLLGRYNPAPETEPDEAVQAGFARAQRLAFEGARHIAGLLQEGWTEKRAAQLLTTYLCDHGVRSFFHESFAWFGERTRFDGIRGYGQFSPSRRCLLPGEVFILDVAPIVDGFVCDIGYTSVLGENPEFTRAERFLREIREKIPALFGPCERGSDVWRTVEQWIQEAGYEAAHRRYPFAVLGHRVHRFRRPGPRAGVLNFGWQSFWALASRGVFGQLLSPEYEGELRGIWAVEPHIGGAGFGAKFEELLLVSGTGARWLDECLWGQAGAQA